MSIPFYAENSYGVIPKDFRFNLPEGYSVLAGKNNSGKSTLLQFVFRSLYSPGIIPRDSFCLIPQDRQYIRPTTQPPTSLDQYNHDMFQTCQPAPRRSDTANIPNLAALYTLCLHRTNFPPQVNELNKFLLRMGFEPVTLRDAQTARVSEVEIASHGSGIRCVLPILAALTSPDIKYLLIDEPELSLEARAQRVLKELLLEAAQAGKTVLVATQSHIFLNKDNVSCNYVVINQGARLVLEQVSEKEKLLDLTFNLLGNSLEDLFFPSNFLIVEGSSDQVICEKVASLLGIPTGRVKIISAQGIDNVSDAYKSIKNTLVPLLADHSPYSKRVVVLLDRPSSDASRSVDEIQNALKERCIVLDKPSLEEYIPEDLFEMAGRNKAFDLGNLKEKATEHKYAKKDETLDALRELKREISSALAAALRHEDLDKIPKIRDAVKLASDRASS